MKRTIKFLLILNLIVILVLSTFAFVACKIPDNPPGEDPNPDENIKTVSFNINGGDGKIESMQFEVGKTMANLPIPERSGYEFVCWADEIGTEYTATTVMPNTNLLLTAKWKITVPFIFSLNSDGKSFSIVGIESTFDGTNIVIPNMYEGKLITEIRDGAFSNCSKVTSITIPDSVTTIDERVFNACSSLQHNEYDNALYLGNANNPYLVLVKAKSTSITSCAVNDNTKIIYYGAFSDCSNLANVTIPDSVTLIADVFSGCSNLQYNEYDNALYLGNADNPYVALVKAASVDITSCEIHNNTKLICYFAFRDCSSLTNITIGNSVRSIGRSAFYNCGNLTSVTIPASVTIIETSAFRDCDSLASFYYAGDVAGWCNIVFGDGFAPLYCAHNLYIRDELVTELVIPDTVTEMNPYTFYGCANISSVTIPDGVTFIGKFAFNYCRDLTSVTIPNGVTTIGAYAFEFCSSLTSITIPDSVTAIGAYAFGYCSSLQYNEYDNALYLGGASNPYLILVKAKSTSITSCAINANTKFINDQAFAYCSNLTSVTIPDSVTSMGAYSFAYCGSLTSVVISKNVTTIPSYAFCGCVNLTSVTIPDGVTTIGDLAFDFCDSLTSVTIPASVTSLGEEAFSYCSNLTSVYYKGTADDWAKISISDVNTPLTNDILYYYSEVEPALNADETDYNGNYWHYVHGVVTVWKKEI